MTFLLAKVFVGSLLYFSLMMCAEDISSYSSEFRSSDTQRYRVSVRHIEGGGIGYNKGYTTLEGFVAPDPKQSTVMPFLDARGHVFNDGKLAANAGIGLRTIAGCRVYGVNAYYDYRNTKKINYNQVGIGFETIGNHWDLRINGYLPVGKKTTAPYQSKFAGFSGNQMKISQKYQSAFTGVQTELGVHFGTSPFFDFYAAAGPYYYTGKVGSQFWGGKGRLTGRFKEYVSLELSNSYDKVFRNRFQCQLTLTLPFGGPSESKQIDHSDFCSMPDVLFSRMVQPVDRQEIVVVGCTKKCEAAIDPVTGSPFKFVFVDNTSHSQGTYESPYPTLALAQAHSGIGDIIYVFPGDGTTHGMDTGITLQLNQKFWGSGTNHTLNTSQGDFIIPAQSSIAPKITNVAGNGITLSAVNQVSGFTLQDVTDNGIVGLNVEKVQISDCTIDHSQSDQIHLEYKGNAGVAALNNLTLINGDLKGIFIDSTTSYMALTMHDCTIQNNANNIIDATFSGRADVSIMNNNIAGNGNGGVINFSGPSTLLVSGNIFNNNTSINIAPLFIMAGESSLSATINKNIIRDNVCGAVRFTLNNTNSAITLNNNTIDRNGIGSIGPSFGSALTIDLNSTMLGNCRLNLTGNIFSGNSASSLYCTNGSYNDFQVHASGNTLTGNGGSGFVFASGSNTFGLNATKNIIANGGDHGITTVGNITIDTANMTISNNQITGNTGFANGIALSHVGSVLNLIVANNDISNNDTSGILMFSSPGVIDKVLVNIANNTINNNQNLGSNASAGIDLEQFTNLSGSITNNTLLNNVGTGMFIGSGELLPSVCLGMTGNNSNTGYTLSSGTGNFNLAPCDAATVNTGLITSIGTITPVQSCPDAVPCIP